jgi:hypothetical protein
MYSWGFSKFWDVVYKHVRLLDVGSSEKYASRYEGDSKSIYSLVLSAEGTS